MNNVGGLARQCSASLLPTTLLRRLHSEPPIDARLVGPASVAHDFSTAPLCVVQLTLLLRNSMAAPAAVCIEVGKLPEGQPSPVGVPTWARPPPSAELGAPGEPARGGSATGSSVVAAGALPPVRQYVWCGRTRLTLPSVPAGQLVDVPLRVAVTRAGKLALADCLVSWHYAGLPHISGSSVVAPHHCTVR